MKVKSFIINANNRLNKIFHFFNSFNNKFSSRNRLINIFLCYFSFYLSDRKSTETRKIYLYKLDEIIFNTSTDPKTAIIILDISIKNQVITFITYIYVYNFSIIKIIYYIINITFTKVELFAIRYRLN